MFETQVVEKVKTHAVFIPPPPRKSCYLWDYVENGRGRPATWHSTAHALCMPDKVKKVVTLRIFNSYCCPTATI